MTREHVFFIPIIFFLGVVVGRLLTRQLSPRQGAHAPTRVSGRGLAISLVAMFVVFAATHMLGMHGGPQAVQAHLGGMQLFDQRPSFSADEVYARIEAFGEHGRGAYARMTFTSDLVFPLVVFAFLVQLIRFVTERAASSRRIRRLALSVPICWLVADLLENATIYSLLENFPYRQDGLAASLGALTYAKFALLLASIVAAAALSLSLPASPGARTAPASK